MLHANVYDAMRKRAQGASLASCTSKDDTGYPWCTNFFGSQVRMFLRNNLHIPTNLVLRRKSYCRHWIILEYLYHNSAFCVQTGDRYTGWSLSYQNSTAILSKIHEFLSMPILDQDNLQLGSVISNLAHSALG